MRQFILLFFGVFMLFSSCDDGDIITINLEFDDELVLCDNNTDSFLIYNLHEDATETLSLIISRSTGSDYPYTEPTPTDSPEVITINGSSTKFYYRTYSRAVSNNDLCNIIAPADLTIINNYESTTGTVEVTVTIDDDDGDGIPSDLEGRGEADENGDYPNALNTDGDAYPDYLDEDDDNDNVKTINEIDTSNEDQDDDPTTNPLDTDNDGIPDYLDEDDDGDLIPTIEEDEDGNKNPRDDLGNNSEDELVAHYLNALEAVSYGSPGINEDNSYTRTVTAIFLAKNINLEVLNTTELSLGTLTYSFLINQ